MFLLVSSSCPFSLLLEHWLVVYAVLHLCVGVGWWNLVTLILVLFAQPFDLFAAVMDPPIAPLRTEPLLTISPVTVANASYFCPECQRHFNDWLRLSAHLAAAQHTLASCGECHEVFPPLQWDITPVLTHQMETQHISLTRPVRVESDFLVSNPDPQSPAHAQYACDCTRVFLSQSQLLEHLARECDKRHPRTGVASSGQRNRSDSDLDRPEQPELDFEKTHWFRLGPELRDVTEHVRTATSGGVSADPTEQQPSDVDKFRCHCDTCAADLLSTGALAQHERVCPKPDLIINGVKLSSFAVRLPPVLSTLRQIDSSAQAGYGILYQCPECFFIFSSWARMERHLNASKHSLGFCRGCHVHLNPRGQMQSKDHGAVTGHTDIIGEHRSKRDYEVVVNIGDPCIAAIVDVALETVNAITLLERVCFQCPQPNCHELFVRPLDLEEHFFSTRHDIMRCETCNERVVVAKSGVFSHEHPITAMVDYTLKPGDDFRVLVTDQLMVERFSHKFVQCRVCLTAVERSRAVAHTGSIECEEAAARRHATTGL